MTKALRLLAALLVAVPLLAQAQRSHSQPELDQMLAPVALYPDPLLSQVLMAATYPDEVAEAARWSRANPGLQGDDAVRAVQNADWDASVKSLVAFPQILARMAENPAWTRSLGDAFLAQEPQVMDTVQQLRRRAQAAGNLQSNEQLQVQQEGEIIMVQPASPQIVYVPYYDPYVVYGPWWWPAYQPVYWSPWPAPLRVHLSLGFFFGNFDWRHRHVRVAHVHNHYYRPRVALAERGRWQHDPRHRRGAEYRSADTVQRFASPRIERREALRVDRLSAPAAVQAQPAVRVQAQPAARLEAQPRTERREFRRESRTEQRQQRGEERLQAAPPVRMQPQAQPQAQPGVQSQARMPAASAPPQPRAERHEHRQERHESRQEQRQERRELRQEQRRERGQKG